MKLKKQLKNFWNFIWKGDSLLSYILFFIFAWVVLKVLFYVLLWFLGFFGVADLTVVITESMIHSQNINQTFYNWLEENNISLQSHVFMDGLNPGDLIVVMKINNLSDLKVGDVIVYNAYNLPIIHRIIRIVNESDNFYVMTKGDANPSMLPFEYKILPNQIMGKAYIKIPYIGIPTMIFQRIIRGV